MRSFFAIALLTITLCTTTAFAVVPCLTMDRTFPDGGYLPGQQLTINVTVSNACTEPVTALAVEEIWPTGWTFVSSSAGAAGQSLAPSPGAGGTLQFVWFSPIPTFPFTLTYVMQVPGQTTGTEQVTGQVLYRLSGPEQRSTLLLSNIPPLDKEPPVIALNGDNPTIVECPAAYVNAGATALDTQDGPLPVTTTNPVNTAVPQLYTVTYTATDHSGNVGTATRTVEVVDLSPPLITINGAASVTLECNSSYADAGASALDACAGDLTGNINTTNNLDTSSPGSYSFTYTVGDPSGNIATATRTVIIEDTHPPVLVLNGSSNISVECHTPFVDPGASASDACAGALDNAIAITGTVDTATPGNYVLTYNVSDPSGNASPPLTRTVHVVDTLPPVITLLGDNPMTVSCPQEFVDPGAMATDSCNGDITVTTSTEPLTGSPASFLVRYQAADASGNTAETTRTVILIGTACGYCFMRDISILTPANNLIIPSSIPSVGVALSSDVLFGDSFDCIFGTVEVVYDLNGVKYHPTAGREEYFPAVAFLEPGTYLMTATATLKETSQQVQSQKTFSIISLPVGENGYPETPFTVISPDGTSFNNTLQTNLFNHTIQIVAADCPADGGSTEDIVLTVYPAFDTTQNLTVTIPRAIVPCGYQMLAVVTLSDSLEGLMGIGESQRFLPLPDGLIAGGLFFDVSLLLADRANMANGEPVLYQEIDNALVAQNPISIALSGLSFTPGLVPLFLSHPSSIQPGNGAEMNLLGETGNWTADETGSYSSNGSTLSAKATALSVFAPFEKSVSLKIEPDIAYGIIFGITPIKTCIKKGFTLTNTGYIDASGVIEIIDSTGAFTLPDEASFSLAPGESTTFTVLFSPCETRDYEATLNIDEDSDRDLSVRLFGTGTKKGFSLFACAPNTATTMGGDWFVLLGVVILLWVDRKGLLAGQGIPG